MDRKGIIIIAACILFVLVWQFYIGPTYFPVRPPERPAPPPESERAAEETESPAQPDPPPPPREAPVDQEPTPAPAVALEVVEPVSEGEIKDVVLESDSCEFTFSSLGGILKNVKLKKYYEEDRETPLTLIRPLDKDATPLGIELVNPKTDLRRVTHRSVESEDSAGFSISLPTGLKIEKRMRLTEGKYDFALEVEFSNFSDQPMGFTAKVHGPGSIVREDELQNYLSGAVKYLKNDSGKAKSVRYGKTWQIPTDLSDDKVPTSDISLVYVGVRNRFFGSVLLSKNPLIVRGMGIKSVKGPLEPTKEDAPGSEVTKPVETMSSFIVLSPIRLEPGESKRFAFTFFAGPQQAEVLSRYEHISDLIDYGMFGAISKLLLVVLKLLYAITRNYGVAIILMTVLVKVVLFPLARKGAISQRKQQMLAPKIKELQAKYKNNKQKLNQETMKLYRSEGVSPVGGCLPMLMQLPVFIGLLRLLQYSIEIRQACFIPGWINDLSKPDTIAALPAWIPVLQGRLNVLPFIMAAVSIIHQRMMPKPADPQQQQQMMFLKFMPLIFVVMLYNWASGLLLYWTVSTALGILEQHILRKTLDLS